MSKQKKPKAVAALRIKNDMDGSYLRAMVGLGPMFGATKAEAMTFCDGLEALRLMAQFPLMVLATLVGEDGKPCDIYGNALLPVPARRRKVRRKA